MLARLPLITTILLVGPVGAGVIGAILPALGHIPSAGLSGPSAEPLRALLAWPGLARAAGLSMFSGLLATTGALLITAFICAGWSGTRSFAWLQSLLSPMLSVPHAAAAFGLAAVIAPAGWIGRALALLLGWDRPPDLLILNDPLGLSLVAGLLLKEVPFLLLMTLAALTQIREKPILMSAQTLGYDRATSWLLTVFPLVYRQIRLPVMVVLAFSMSVVDVALILGPTTPPTLSVQIVRWMSDPDLAQRSIAAAAALLQLGLCLLALALWWLAERLVAAQAQRWLSSGRRQRFAWARPLGMGAGLLCIALSLLGLAALALWSVAGLWSFPDLLPQSISLRTWARHGAGLGTATWNTALVAGAAVGCALCLCLALLEAEYRTGVRVPGWVLYLPLLVPQTVFLPGLTMILLRIRADTGVLPVMAAHLIFVLPYIYLSLGDPYRQWDPKLARLGHSLGAGQNRVFWALRLPMLLQPILIATAVGLAVSVGQYLPTLLTGGGRVATLTTEAVALSSGADRRAIGLYSLAQTAAALAPFALAIAVPRLVYRNRKALLNG